MAAAEVLTLTGPGVDLRLRDGVGAGISRAVTAAERGGLEEASYYLRDARGLAVARIDREGGMTVVRRLDREAGDASRPATRRPGTPEPRNRTEEDEMAEQRTRNGRSAATRTRSSSRPAAKKPAAQAKTPTAKSAVAVAAPAEAAAGNVLYQGLLEKVREAVEGVQVKENKSGTYSRLLTSSGKAFAYIFPPRKGGVALKIPKQLLAVERELPEGHGFKTTGWGLTRTVRDAGQTPVVAKALAVAAKAVGSAS